jgi:hypothetical protein
VGQRWLDRFGVLEGADFLVLSATHPMTPEPVRRLADDIFKPAIEAAIKPWGLTSFVYHTMSVRDGTPRISTGGNAPGIARNAFGLMGAVSFLLETRGVGIGLVSYQRRVATHYIAIRSLLESASANSAQLAKAVAKAREIDAQGTEDLIIGHTVSSTLTELPMLDPVTGAPKPLAVTVLDSRVVTGLERRARPAGYAVSPDKAAAVAQRLALFGARACRLRVAIDAPVERYEVLDRAETDRRSINPGSGITVRLIADHATLAAGTLFVPLDQPEGTQIALALEPDSPGSLSAAELFDRANPALMKIWRVPKEAVAADWNSRMDCDKQRGPQ